jgi:hypothetical protein
MKTQLLSSRKQPLGWILITILGLITLLILFSAYFYLAILTLLLGLYISWKIPYASTFSKGELTVKTIIVRTTYAYADIKNVQLIFPNAQMGHILKFEMNNGKDFSIDYQDKYWTQDLCNILRLEKVRVINKDFVWMQLKENHYVVKNGYPRNNREVDREKLIVKSYE